MKMTATCPICKNEYFMGYTGTVNGCDKCMGVERDKEGNAWDPNEQEQTYAPVGGSKADWFTVTRAEAFGHNEG